MKQNDIKGLSYAQFKKELKEVENRLNYYFKNRNTIYEYLYLELNFILYGLDAQYKDQYDILANEGKLIFSKFQNFYIDESKPYFVIAIECRELNESIDNIKIRLLQ